MKNTSSRSNSFSLREKISIIIPTREINDYLQRETIPAILEQTYQDFEIIVLPDKPLKEKFSKTKIISTGSGVGPADKRDLGVRKAKGSIVAFIDDDAYPEKHWLKNAIRWFKNPNIAGICGPGITPPTDNIRQKVSGWVWQSWLGAGGAGTYRCRQEKKREVDDYPAFNLIVRKKDFQAVGGFDSHFWPGEDTKLCFDLVYKLGKKIIYDPKIIVFHHRRPVFIPHLEQISRFAIHRGHFVRILPRTSLRIGYFIPSFFVLGLGSGFFLSFVHPFFKTIYLSVLGIYFFLLLLTSIEAFLKEKSLKLAFFLAPAIFLTHFVYGVLFIKGYFSPKLER